MPSRLFGSGLVLIVLPGFAGTIIGPLPVLIAMVVGTACAFAGLLALAHGSNPHPVK